MTEPLAYLLTWTTYGTRLHGDVRGSVDRRSNAPGTPLLPASPARAARTEARMVASRVLLDGDARELVTAAIRDHALKRSWRILALAIRSNHAHVLVDCRGPCELVEPERVMQEFKSWATRRLRSAGLFAQSKRIWTDHGSTRWINNETGLVAAMDYVERLQGGREGWAE